MDTRDLAKFAIGAAFGVVLAGSASLGVAAGPSPEDLTAQVIGLRSDVDHLTQNRTFLIKENLRLQARVEGLQAQVATLGKQVSDDRREIDAGRARGPQSTPTPPGGKGAATPVSTPHAAPTRPLGVSK